MGTPAALEARYLTGELLGRGGMAEVYGGVDTRLGRRVAIKQLRADLAANPTCRARFRREATAAARLSHPSIVAVFDTAEIESSAGGGPVPIIVMELVDGHSLREALRAGTTFTPERAMEITGAILDALATSHSAGIIHRDIKPANVLLTTAGQVKVADFGIARSVSDASATVTQTATVLGTAAYMSPEQARGQAVDPRSDIYSVGCVLYELLVGRPPFSGESALSVVYQQVADCPANPRSLDPRIPADVDAIVMRALQKAPDDRYQTASQMRADIADVRSGQPLTAELSVPPDPSRTGDAVPVEDTVPIEPLATRRRGLAGVLAMVILLILGIAGYGYVRSVPGSAPVPGEVPAVLGFNQAQAESMLRNAGLDPRTQFVTGPDATVNTVIRQTPAGGEQPAPDRVVTVEINTGPANVTVPDGLLGRNIDQVEKLLEQAGFTNVTTRAVASASADVATGAVTAIDPAEGRTVSPTAQVTVTYASGSTRAAGASTQPTTNAGAGAQAGTSTSGPTDPKGKPSGSGDGPASATAKAKEKSAKDKQAPTKKARPDKKKRN